MTANAWDAALSGTLDAVVGAGAAVAWIGADEGCFVDPPELFATTRMTGCVLACVSDDGTRHLPLRADRPIVPVGDDVLVALRRRVHSLLQDSRAT